MLFKELPQRLAFAGGDGLDQAERPAQVHSLGGETTVMSARPLHQL
jgi:hypothetical protein